MAACVFFSTGFGARARVLADGRLLHVRGAPSSRFGLSGHHSPN
jgi:hypothetical protein